MDEAQKSEIVGGLKIKHPAARLSSLEFTDGTFLVHRTTAPGERRIYDQMMGEGKKFDAEGVLLDCVLYPEKQALKEFLDLQPFAVVPICNAVLAASGIDMAATRKKL